MAWQGYLRRLAHRYDNVIVCCPRGYQPLYQDFTSDFIEHCVTGVKDCWHITPDDPAKLRAVEETLAGMVGDHIVPYGYIPLEQQVFIRYGDASKLREDQRFDIVLHARSRIGKRPGHAWDPDTCDRVASDLSGYRVAAIGTEAYCPPGAADLRGIPLDELMNIMAGAKVFVGPSSGPAHLASLCGLPHIVWTDRDWYSAIRATNRERYEKLWNPHATPVTIIDRFGWSPPANVIVEEILKGIQKWQR